MALRQARVQIAIYLGDLKEGLGDVDNAAHLFDILNAGLDGLGVVGAGAVEDVLDLLVLSLGPLLVSRAAVLEQTGPDGQQAHGNNRLLVHDVVLIAEGIDAETGGTAEEGSLADEAAAGQGVDDALGLLLGLLGGHVARVSHSGGRNGRGGSGDGGSEEGSACSLLHLIVSVSAHQLRLSRRQRVCVSATHTDSASYQAGRHCENVSDGGSRPCR